MLKIVSTHTARFVLKINRFVLHTALIFVAVCGRIHMYRCTDAPNASGKHCPQVHKVAGRVSAYMLTAPLMGFVFAVALSSGCILCYNTPEADLEEETTNLHTML